MIIGKGALWQLQWGYQGDVEFGARPQGRQVKQQVSKTIYTHTHTLTHSHKKNKKYKKKNTISDSLIQTHTHTPSPVFLQHHTYFPSLSSSRLHSITRRCKTVGINFNNITLTLIAPQSWGHTCLNEPICSFLEPLIDL